MTCFLPLYRKVTKSTVAKQMDVAFTQVKGPRRSKNSCKVKWRSVDSMMCSRISVHDKNVPQELSTVVINPRLIGINPGTDMQAQMRILFSLATIQSVANLSMWHHLDEAADTVDPGEDLVRRLSNTMGSFSSLTFTTSGSRWLFWNLEKTIKPIHISVQTNQLSQL